ncbi:MAG: site-specific integrase [Kiloniellales bacterium]|nr:site-specific integrase [Kiloniellales bacterium]
MPDPPLSEFSSWLRRRGSSAKTIAAYTAEVRKSLACGHITDRLVSKDYAPKTRRVTLASLRAWARYTENRDLGDLLDSIHLPPARRVQEKFPLSLDEWQAVIEAVDALAAPAAVRAIAGLICVRGFRVGDACDIQRLQAQEALRTGVLAFEVKGGTTLRWTARPFERYLALLPLSAPWNIVADLISPRARCPADAAVLRIQREFADLSEAAGLGNGAVSPHRLRRTYAVHFLEEVGGDLAKLRDHMGWANIATAAQYVDHSRREELDVVADRMRDRLKSDT